MPFISFDVVSYFAGATRMRFPRLLDCYWARATASNFDLFLLGRNGIAIHQMDIVRFRYCGRNFNREMVNAEIVNRKPSTAGSKPRLANRD